MKRTYLLLLAVTLICYANSLSGELLSDDLILIVRNQNAHEFSRLYRLFTQNYFHTVAADGTYRPVSSISFALNYLIHGEHTLGYHIFNTLLHFVNTALLYRLTLQVTKREFLALANALIFATHPVRVEAVAFISGRPEMLATLFILIAIGIYLKDRTRLSSIISTASLSALALFSKESAICLPGILLLLDSYLDREGLLSWQWLKRRLPPLTAYILVIACYSAARYTVLGAMGVPIENTVFKTTPFASRVLTMGGAFIEYFRLMVWPVKLRFEYDFSVIPLESLSLTALVRLVVVVGVLLAGLILHSRAQIVSFSILLFFSTIFTVSNIAIPTGILMAERVLYIPAIGFGLIAAYSLDLLYQRDRRTAIIFLIIITGAFSIRTILRNRDWQTRASYIEAYVRDVPGSYKSALLDAYRHAEHGDMKGAEEAFVRATHLSPQEAQTYAELGVFYLDQNRDREAAIALEKALQLSTRNVSALLGRSRLSFKKGEYDRALETTLEALRYSPENDAILYNAGYICYQIGRYEEAERYLTRAHSLDTGNISIRLMLARVLISRGDLATAASEIDEVYRLEPENSEVLLVRGLLKVSQGRYDSALDDFEEARRLGLNTVELDYATGLAFYRQGKMSLARRYLNSAQEHYPAAKTLLKSLP